ncbi:MAG: DUF3302 domain-containing protein [Thalassotalea sp.]|nr:DUF3302 domain-containing protein [Thalassotalea sp.]MDG2393025.1 DUF3302 domain-containing protein [Thalassotalea sp.]
MLEYFALFLVFFVLIVVFYGIIVVHEIPYDMAVKNNHPQKDAIHVGGWISLFTVGAIWPFLWIWANLKYDNDGKLDNSSKSELDTLTNEVNSLKNELDTIKQQLNKES